MTKDEKVTAFDNSNTKAISSAWLGTKPKRCELQLFFTTLGRAIRHWKALDLGSLSMQFQQDWPEDRKITALIFLHENVEKILSTERLSCASGGINNFFFSAAPQTLHRWKALD